jgi:hypothetical protein
VLHTKLEGQHFQVRHTRLPSMTRLRIQAYTVWTLVIGVVTVAFDPEGTGPDTHYKVLQVRHHPVLV